MSFEAKYLALRAELLALVRTRDCPAVHPPEDGPSRRWCLRCRVVDAVATPEERAEIDREHDERARTRIADEPRPEERR